jgi:hypothetical protein
VHALAWARPTGLLGGSNTGSEVFVETNASLYRKACALARYMLELAVRSPVGTDRETYSISSDI